MKRSTIQAIAAAVACMGMLLPQTVFGVQPVHPASDIALAPGGLLTGQVVDENGTALVGMPVVIRHGQQDIVRTTTDAQGAFYAQGLRGGSHEIVTAAGPIAYRFWAPDTAPPAAQQAATVVASSEIVRGQWGYGPGGAWMNWVRSHPYITAGVIGAAIAIPLAIADDDWDPSS